MAKIMEKILGRLGLVKTVEVAERVRCAYGGCRRKLTPGFHRQEKGREDNLYCDNVCVKIESPGLGPLIESRLVILRYR